MKQVTYKDLQYKKEIEFFGKLQPMVQSLQNKNREFSKKVQQQEKDFFKHLSHSIRVDRLTNISDLVSKLNERLNTNFKINLFLYSSPIANALCIPRYTYTLQDSFKELTIIVSQHFLNNLNPDEQISVLGHELAHLVYGHVHIPAKVILQSPFAMRDIQDLKSTVLKWRICAEISCDLVAFLSCECNALAFSLAMIKFTSGLTDDAIAKLDEEHLLDLMLKQYDDISEALFDSPLTTHPLTPLRLKVINIVKDSNLISYYGQTISEKDIEHYQDELNRKIDEVVRNIYPEIITNRDFKGNKVLFDMCIAVALSDGHIDKRELQAIQRIIQSDYDIAQSYSEIVHALKAKGQRSLLEGILNRAVCETVKQQYVKRDILNIIRHLLMVAASDGIVDKCELETIFNFSKEFGIKKEEIAFVINQMGLI